MSCHARTSHRRLAVFVAGALLLAAPLARADWVASEEEERAYLAKMKRGVPPTVGKVAKQFPGAVHDPQCSLRAWGGSEDNYAFRTRATPAEVEQFFRDNVPDATAGTVAVYGANWCTSDSGTTDYVVRVWSPQKATKLKAAAEARRTGIAQLAASPPAPESAGLPLPAGAAYDPECSYDVDLDRRQNYAHRYDSVTCYAVDAADYDAAVTALRAVGVRAGSIENNVQPEIRGQKAPVKIAYWVLTGGPTRTLAEWQAANAPKPQASTAHAANAPAQNAPAAQPPTPTAENPAETAKNAVRKLKGLFGR